MGGCISQERQVAPRSQGKGTGRAKQPSQGTASARGRTKEQNDKGKQHSSSSVGTSTGTSSSSKGPPKQDSSKELLATQKDREDDEPGVRAGAGQATQQGSGSLAGVESLRIFTARELQRATKRYSVKLGEGGFGSVFRGKIALLDPATGKAREDGQLVDVAVKVLDANSHQGPNEWQTEIGHLADLKHENVVRLLGYCQEPKNWMLIYEFVPYGSFDYHLFDPGRPPVSYANRLKVALHAARGLEFLHQNNVIYRDFKTSNVLVDQNFNAKLADFGLAREGPDQNRTHVSTAVKGTLSYMAPDYISSGHLTKSCDVYSFGVVLLELLAGRQASAKVNLLKEPTQRLVECAHEFGRDRARQHEFIDPRLKDSNGNGQGLPIRAFRNVLQAALACIDSKPQLRPEISTVLEQLTVAYSLCLSDAKA